MSNQTFRQSRYSATPAPSNQRAKTFVDEMPRFQWATRWELAEVDENGEPVRKSGWVVERGKFAELDAAAKASNLQWFNYTHPSSGTKAVYWLMREAHFFFAITGVLSDWDMKKDLEARTGFSYARKDHGNGDTILRIVGFCEELYDAGFHDPIYITVNRRTAFQDMLRGLSDHYRALEKFAELRGDPTQLPAFYEVACGLGTGKVEKRGTSQTAFVTPIVSTLPEEVTRDYLIGHYINLNKRKGLFDAIEGTEEEQQKKTALIDRLLVWAVEDGKRIYDMTDDQKGVAGADPEATSYVTAKSKPQPQPDSSEDLPF